jgi:S-phase kinase-associated protein 1
MEIHILTGDCQSFCMHEKSAMMSGTIQKLREDILDDDPDQVIPLPNMTGPTMVLVIQYCDMYQAHKLKGLSEATTEFLAPLHVATIFDLLHASNYLDIQPLLICITSHVASLMRGKTPQEIRETFQITNDFTPEEEAQILEENAWAFVSN